MPEGPSLIILKEAISHFKGKKIMEASGTTDGLDPSKLEGKTIRDLKTWGKHLLICFSDFTVRVHLMLLGTYRINEQRKLKPRLSLIFNDGELNFYTVQVKLIEEDLDVVYDWSADVMNPKWDPGKAIDKLTKRPKLLICDALLDQKIFSGVGNIIKNEALFRAKIHPLNKVSEIPEPKLKLLLKEVVDYSFDFLKWKKEHTLSKHWEVYTKKKCPRDNSELLKDYLGSTKRRTYYCEKCQNKY